jgi:hypothetical protein
LGARKDLAGEDVRPEDFAARDAFLFERVGPEAVVSVGVRAILLGSSDVGERDEQNAG